MPGPTDKRAVGLAVGLARGVVALALRMFGGDEVRTSVAFRIKVKHYRLKEDGVSILEYVLLVALVAMVATGTLLYLGREAPAHRMWRTTSATMCPSVKTVARGVRAARP